LLIDCKDEVTLSLHWSIQDIRGFDWTFFESPEKRIEFIPRYTGILHLKDFGNFDQYISSISSGRKYDFKLRKELSVTEHVDAVSVDTFLEMYSETVPFLTYDSRIYALEQVRKIIVDSIAAATGTLWLGQDETGKTVAGVFVQEFQGTLYYQFGASLVNGLKYSPNAVILLKIIEKAFSDGARIIDFVGINSPARGGFKSSLNATPQLYFQVHIK
jgi:lipid II:glycine glycyltransferase (peptidoglycan interpeptide bridge formation enzyme)